MGQMRYSGRLTGKYCAIMVGVFTCLAIDTFQLADAISLSTLAMGADKPSKPAEYSLDAVQSLELKRVIISKRAAPPAEPTADSKTKDTSKTETSITTTTTTVTTTNTTVLPDPTVKPEEPKKEKPPEFVTKARLTYEGGFDFADGVLSLPVEPDQVTLRNGDDPVNWSLTNPTPADTKNTVRVLKPAKAGDFKPLTVEITIDGLDAAYSLNQSVDVATNVMSREIRITNSSPLNWGRTGSEFQLTVVDEKAKVLYQNEKMKPLEKTAGVTLSERLSTSVNTSGAFVDLNGFIDDKANLKTATLTGFPRLMELTNRASTDAVSSAIQAGNIEIRGKKDDLERLKASASLDKDLPLGTNCDAAACGLSAQNYAYLPIADESRILAMTVKKGLAQPLLPLSFSQGNLAYLRAEVWTVQIKFRNDPVDVRFIDTRTTQGITPFWSLIEGSQTQFKVYSITLAPALVSQTVSPEELAVLLKQLSKNLNEITAIHKFENLPCTDRFLSTLNLYYCLDPIAKANIEAKSLQQYLETLKKSMQSSGEAAENYIKNVENIVDLQRKKKSLEDEVLRLSGPVRKGDFGREILVRRIQMEKHEEDSQRLSLDLQRMQVDLMQAFASAPVEFERAIGHQTLILTE